MNTFSFAAQLPIDEGYDVCVAGGGPAGVTAAICAARRGARVVLLESMGCLGGMATTGLVTAWDCLADGEKPMVGGVMREVVETLWQRGQIPASSKPADWETALLTPIRFHPEPVKRLYDEMCETAGVEVRFFSSAAAVDVDADGKTVKGVIVAQTEGLRYIRAKSYVDATGDAHLAAWAGVEYRLAGRDTEHIMPCSLCWVTTGIDWARGERADDYVEQARAKGDFPYGEFRSVISYIGDASGGFNTGHLYELDATDTRALSEGMREGRRIAQTYNEFYRKYVPGYEKAELTETAQRMGVRETRRIVGEFELTLDDMTAWRHFPDQVGIYNKEIDIHAYGDDPAELERARAFQESRVGWPKPGQSYGIPYGVIVPRGWTNLWVPGRSASADVMVQGSLRVMPAAAMMGQAAGTAAAQSVHTGQAACELDVAQLVSDLRADGAILPQTETPSSMTRSARD
jgi:hypothetical protein